MYLVNSYQILQNHKNYHLKVDDVVFWVCLYFKKSEYFAPFLIKSNALSQKRTAKDSWKYRAKYSNVSKFKNVNELRIGDSLRNIYLLKEFIENFCNIWNVFATYIAKQLVTCKTLS